MDMWPEVFGADSRIPAICGKEKSWGKAEITMEQKKNYIETKPIDKPFFKKVEKDGQISNKRNLVGLGKTKFVGKLVTDALGNEYKVEQEKFSLVVDN